MITDERVRRVGDLRSDEFAAIQRLIGLLEVGGSLRDEGVVEFGCRGVFRLQRERGKRSEAQESRNGGAG